MLDLQFVLTILVFAVTVLFILWRPFGINESLPTIVGAVVLLAAGIVPLMDAWGILGMISGATITILSTIVMSIVLESIGFFRWAAFNLAKKAKGSGIRLYWYINLLCFLMTMFFNNDGSILITTPIIIQTLTLLKMKPHQKIPYLLSGALIATSSSAPIGVSNLANLIALNIVGLDLNTYAAFMFVPSMLGIVAITFLFYLYFKEKVPKKIPELSNRELEHIISTNNGDKPYHPLSTQTNEKPFIDWKMFRICITVVVLTRISFFVLAPFHIPTEYPSIIGAVLLILLRWFRKGIGIKDILKKTPWHIVFFAFGMYVIIFGLHNTGLTSMIVERLGSLVSENHFNAIFIMGILLSVMSNLCNNLPSVMIGTMSLTEMGLDHHTLQVAYLANVIGADIGSLLLPMGTLASLIWMFILKQNKIPFTWGQYLKATILVIPIGLLISLFSLYVWTEWLLR
ncbi:arsenic transporter [Bacillus sp. 1P06AnD]|uniref:arsenic transporter n=1 Tax=Bacillus sp. 1P06AnD TaxID=3132208 RepID=UPI0039A27196